jgi:GT2 family glycosyltransferase
MAVPVDSTSWSVVEHLIGPEPEIGPGPIQLAERLTIVLLTFNCAHRITGVLDRLREANVPIVAVDNGSHDSTAEVLEAYGGVTVVRLPHNIGAAGRTAGAEVASTPYVAFCDDDGWFEPNGLIRACDVLDQYPRLGLVNARILVGPRNRLDPISSEMAASPILDRYGLPGTVLLSFMAGAAIMRAEAFWEVGGYDERFFIGGEEETLALPLAKAGWQMRYLDDVVMHHRPSLANATKLRAYGMRNTLVNAWLHRPWTSALQWTAFTLADTPKNADYLRGLMLTIRAIGWIRSERAVVGAALDADLRALDARRFVGRRPFFTWRSWRPGDT